VPYTAIGPAISSRRPRPEAKIDPQRLTQVDRAMQQLGIRMIPAYSPQARGRSERNFGTWQGRLPQELRLRGITTVEEGNRFLRQEYVAEFNRGFAVAAAQPGSAFLPLQGQNLERVFALQHERVVNRDNTVEIAHRVLQLEKTSWRNTLAGCAVTVYQHLDGTLSVGYGPHLVGHFNAEGIPLPQLKRRPKAVEKTLAAPPWKNAARVPKQRFALAPFPGSQRPLRPRSPRRGLDATRPSAAWCGAENCLLTSLFTGLSHRSGDDEVAILNLESGHFTCYKKRTSSRATDSQICSRRHRCLLAGQLSSCRRGTFGKPNPRAEKPITPIRNQRRNTLMGSALH
jgi:hypothetical protein